MQQIANCAQPSFSVVQPSWLIHGCVAVQAHLRPADALPCVVPPLDPLRKCACRPFCAGVVQPIHPLTGVFPARLPLFSGDAIPI